MRFEGEPQQESTFEAPLATDEAREQVSERVAQLCEELHLATENQEVVEAEGAFTEAIKQSPEGEKFNAAVYTLEDNYRKALDIVANAESGAEEQMIARHVIDVMVIRAYYEAGHPDYALDKLDDFLNVLSEGDRGESAALTYFLDMADAFGAELQGPEE